MGVDSAERIRAVVWVAAGSHVSKCVDRRQRFDLRSSDLVVVVVSEATADESEIVRVPKGRVSSAETSIAFVARWNVTVLLGLGLGSSRTAASGFVTATAF